MEARPENLGSQEVIPMMWYWGGGVHWWGWLLGALAMVAFWGVLIWAVWYFVTAVTRRPDGKRSQGDRPGTADPKRILDERLARGDIDAEEYRRLRDLLQERDRSTPGAQRPTSTADRTH